MRDDGVLGPRTTAVHATHLTDQDIADLDRTATGVCFCPTTERDLGDGIGPAPALLAGRGLFSLGSDSHAVIDLFEEARAVELDERLARRNAGSSLPTRLLRCRDAATAIGRSAGPTRASCGSALARTWLPSTLDRCARQVVARRWRTSSSPRRRPTSPTWSSTDDGVVVDRADMLPCPDVGWQRHRD